MTPTTSTTAADPLLVDLQRRKLCAEENARQLLAVRKDRDLTMPERMAVESWYDDIGRYSQLLAALGAPGALERRPRP